MSRKFKCVVISLVVLLPASCTGTFVLRDLQLHTGFRNVEIGMSQDEVLRILGKPRDAKGCSGIFAPYRRADCKEGYVYASAWAPLNPSYPVVWFGGDKRVIDKYEFSSP